MNDYYFPFGKKLEKVQQKDRTPKKAFVLGVYASAVHARWVDKNRKQKVAALAVASEPEIFWRGDTPESIISKIKVPEQLGKLIVPTDKRLNGPSGRALDDYFLKPLGLTRETVWLCDLLPESRVNEKQKSALKKFYTPEIVKEYGLTPASVPDFNEKELDSPLRRQEILGELEASQAETLILLGDLPINWFLRFHDKRFTKLSKFGDSPDTYGHGHEITINGKKYNVIPLCHPRQAGRLGSANAKWGKLHDEWVKNQFLLK